MIRILNESGHERNRNAGDEAYFAAMVDIFRKRFQKVEITAFSDRPDHDRQRYGVRTIFSGGSLTGSFRSLTRIFKAIKVCDIYLWGAGQILRDDNFIFSPPYRLARPLLASLMGKPVMAFGVGIGPLDTKPIRFLARLVLRQFTLITYRDETTGTILRGLGLKEELLQKTVDPAFGLIPANEKEIDECLRQMGIDPEGGPIFGAAPFGPAYRGKFSGIRNFLPAKFQADRDMWQSGGKAKYREHIKLLAEFYDHTITTYGAQLVFVIQDASGQGLDDKITYDIIAALDNPSRAVIMNGDDFPPAVIKGLMGRMEVVTGGRMHSLILAAGINTPIMAICYEKKIKALASVIDQAECFLDGYTLDGASLLIELFDDIWTRRDSIKACLIKRNCELMDEVNHNVERIAKLLRWSDDA